LFSRFTGLEIHSSTARSKW